MFTDPVFMDFINLVASQLVGFFLWLIVFPLRLIIAVLDPVFEPISTAIDVDAFLDGIDFLRPFFSDVNWFIPFGAALGVLGATVVVMFVLVLIDFAVSNGVGHFGSFAMGVMWHMVQNLVDGIKRVLGGIFKLFFG